MQQMFCGGNREMNVSKGNFHSIEAIKQAIENHLVSRTSVATLEFVVEFWATDIDLGDDALSIVRSMDRLEAKMLAERGWHRKDRALMQKLADSDRART